MICIVVHGQHIEASEQPRMSRHTVHNMVCQLKLLVCKHWSSTWGQMLSVQKHVSCWAGDLAEEAQQQAPQVDVGEAQQGNASQQDVRVQHQLACLHHLYHHLPPARTLAKV